MLFPLEPALEHGYTMVGLYPLTRKWIEGETRGSWLEVYGYKVVPPLLPLLAWKLIELLYHDHSHRQPSELSFNYPFS